MDYEEILQNYRRKQLGVHGTLDERKYYLAEAARVPIKRHTEIQGDANPFDPEWECYFEKRLDEKMVNTTQGKQWLISLGKNKRGAVQSVAKRLLRRPDGIAITSSIDPKEDLTQKETAFFSIQRVINKFTAKV